MSPSIKTYISVVANQPYSGATETRFIKRLIGCLS